MAACAPAATCGNAAVAAANAAACGSYGVPCAILLTDARAKAMVDAAAAALCATGVKTACVASPTNTTNTTVPALNGAAAVTATWAAGAASVAACLALW